MSMAGIRYKTSCAIRQGKNAGKAAAHEVFRASFPVAPKGRGNGASGFFLCGSIEKSGGLKNQSAKQGCGIKI